MTAPIPGTRRARRMDLVKRYLRSVGASTYRGIESGTGLSAAAVGRAIGDLQRYDPDVLAVPAYGNRWETSLGWTLEARIGEVSQLRHNATRVTNQANRLSKIAAVTTNVYEKATLEAEARNMRASGANLNALADAMEATP